MRTAYMDEIRKKLAVFAESTKNHFDMDFNSKLKHSIVELDNIEEYDITFTTSTRRLPRSGRHIQSAGLPWKTAL